MAHLDSYLGQSLKEIVPDADAVLIFVGVSHDSCNMVLSSVCSLFIVARCRVRVRVQGGLDVAKAGLVQASYGLVFSRFNKPSSGMGGVSSAQY